MEDSGTSPTPTVTISSPAEADTLNENETITLIGEASDPEDGTLSGENLVWTSKVDDRLGSIEERRLGTGDTLTVNLSPALHTITLTATNSADRTDQDSASVAVNGPPIASITSPENESGVDEGAVTLTGTGADPVGGELEGDRLEWSSDVDGSLGVGDGLSPALSPGPHALTLTVTDRDGDTASATADIVVEQPGFDARLRFLSDFTEGQKGTVREALAPWEGAITGDLRPLFPPSGQAAQCELQERGIDDLAIAIQKANLDGPGGTLAQAGPCLVRTADTEDFATSASGIVTIDAADLENPKLKEIVTHEVGHALGIGIGSIQGWGENTTDLNTLDPSHTGANTTEAFDQLDGSSAYLSEGVPLENIGGGGTAGAHWRQGTLGGNNFESELMTGFINADSELPLSRVTLAALQDIGYEVDLSAADPFDLPMPQETLWRPVADATLSRPASSDENFGVPGGNGLADVLVAGSNNDMLWSTDPEGEVFSSLVRFDVPSSLPMGVTVNSAVGNLVVTDRNAETTGHDITVSPVAESWSEGDVTWNNRPALRDTIDAFDFESCERCTPDVTGVARSWLTGSAENHGIALRAPDAPMDSTFSVGFFSRHVDRIPQRLFRRPALFVFAETGSSSLKARPQVQEGGQESRGRIPLGNDIRSGPLIGIDAEGRVVRTGRLRPDRLR
ncbi:DNRLRE domain-containing protein [Salinibacter altiplanensis]|uniref:DNRLRE domain-containing protein n=1 Tax=Salinibacter altiplanensis TaxID=1803181 RepID=UPI000C9F63C4|nr:DNRLRE domain-containing protein [Salinibacter altiplanensis]